MYSRYLDSVVLTSKSKSSLKWTPPPEVGVGRTRLVEESWENRGGDMGEPTWMTEIIVSRTGSFSLVVFPSLGNRD